MTPNRNYKDSVFRLVFNEKEALLSLYNAMNETNYTNVDDLEINTLENVIYMSMKNDVSFVFNSGLHIYEHQSTDNPNMPLRDLFYVATLYEKIIQKKTLYSAKPIKIPMPKFVVFYNGIDKDMKEVSEYRLSDLYEIPELLKMNKDENQNLKNNELIIEHDLELRVKVLNINADMSYNIKKQCRKLEEYCLYVEKVRELARFKPIEDAVDEAIEYCIENDILRELLIDQKLEVRHVSILEFNEERDWEIIKEDFREMGLAEGRAKGLEEGRAEGQEDERKNIILNMLNLGIAKEEIAKLINISLEDVEKYIQECTDK